MADTIPAIAVLVPVKAFQKAKLRLARLLPDGERQRLARLMAERVLAAAVGTLVAVVCDDDDVAEWADDHGAEVIWAPGRGLNGAVGDGVAWLAAHGIARVVISHADIPFAHDLAAVADFDGVTLVADRHRDGTNVLCVPSPSGFEFAYGPRSFRRHRAEAERLRLPVRVLDDARLAWDVDRPADLRFPPELAADATDLVPAACS
ncbi:MAG: 2-phospho-L-lactate guanylyltransferase [Acidimicrobiales bacterium]